MYLPIVDKEWLHPGPSWGHQRWDEMLESAACILRTLTFIQQLTRLDIVLIHPQSLFFLLALLGARSSAEDFGPPLFTSPIVQGGKSE
jgi:hypothetical protein